MNKGQHRATLACGRQSGSPFGRTLDEIRGLVARLADDALVASAEGEVATFDTLGINLLRKFNDDGKNLGWFPITEVEELEYICPQAR